MPTRGISCPYEKAEGKSRRRSSTPSLASRPTTPWSSLGRKPCSHPATRRWRRVFKLMHGYGEWLQLSLFQCRLSRRRRVELAAAPGEIVHHQQDHVPLRDLGHTDRVDLRVTSLGTSFAPVVREPIIV
jgi:CRISPR-associated protein Cas2